MKRREFFLSLLALLFHKPRSGVHYFRGVPIHWVSNLDAPPLRGDQVVEWKNWTFKYEPPPDRQELIAKIRRASKYIKWSPPWQ